MRTKVFGTAERFPKEMTPYGQKTPPNGFSSVFSLKLGGHDSLPVNQTVHISRPLRGALYSAANSRFPLVDRDSGPESARLRIVTGPIIYGLKPTLYLGQRELDEVMVAIPDAFFKIIIREVEGEDPAVLAFIYPQRGIQPRIERLPNCDAHMCSHNRVKISAPKTESCIGYLQSDAAPRTPIWGTDTSATSLTHYQKHKKPAQFSLLCTDRNDPVE